VFLGVFIFSIILGGKYLLDTNQSQSVIKDLQVINDENKIEMKDDSDIIQNGEIEDEEDVLIIEETSTRIEKEVRFTFNKNPEKMIFDEIENYVGWISIADTNIDYPVVKYQDNEFYLNHGYDLKENIAGAIFMDRRNLGNQFDQHTIIYGHRMKNNTMFTDLNLYLDDTFFKENQLIVFRDLYNTYTYKVFSAYNISADDYILAYDINQDVINEFKNISNHFDDHIYNEENRYLTLSTCNYEFDNGRMLVHAVLIQVN
jgi:sortase B